jgi:4-hydroxy-tetrahydrodipicolinate synthase
MLTPFDVNGDVDHDALDALVDWYLSKGVAGLFAVCQSSEMFALSLEERTEIA